MKLHTAARVMTVVMLILFGGVRIYAQQSSGSMVDKSDCVFSEYKTLKFTDFLPSIALIPAKKVEPKYPALARRANLQAEVEVFILVDRKGNVLDACTSKEHLLLADAAKRAALQWKFKVNPYISKRTKYRYVEHMLNFNFQIK